MNVRSLPIIFEDTFWRPFEDNLAQQMGTQLGKATTPSAAVPLSSRPAHGTPLSQVTFLYDC